MGYGGYVFFLFRRKERTKEKSIMSFSRKCILVRAFLGELYIGRCVCFLSLRYRSKSQRRFRFPCLRLTQAIICIRFGIPRMDASCLGSLSPAPCSPPLGGSIAGSAVRFTPAVKYGGREKVLICRATGCMSSQSCPRAP